MQGYITAILVMAVAIFVMQAVAPSSPGLKTAISSAAAVALLAVLLLPLGTVEWEISLPNLSQASALEAGNSAYLAAMAKGYEEGIGEDLRDKWGLSDFDVRITQNEGGAPTALCVALRGSDVVKDGVGIRRYAEETYGIPCEIVYE